MRFFVAIRAAIADDLQSVVRVGGMAQCREYDATGDDPVRMVSNVAGAQYQVDRS